MADLERLDAAVDALGDRVTKAQQALADRLYDLADTLDEVTQALQAQKPVRTTVEAAAEAMREAVQHLQGAITAAADVLTDAAGNGVDEFEDDEATDDDAPTTTGDVAQG